MVALGNVAVETIYDWEPGSRSIVTWGPSPASSAAADRAPVDDTPPSYMQAQHLRGYREHASRGLRMSRLCIATWDIPGRCDVRAMTYIVNAHLRRHDTYRSWFACDDDGNLERHRIADAADIQFVPTRHRDMSADQWRTFIADTPDPLQWDCFRFGIIQHADRFTFCVAVDHLHVDAMFMGSIFVEVHAMYAALIGGAAPLTLPDAGSYDAFCIRQQHHIAGLTAESPEVAQWVEFALRNEGSMPSFPLPIGDVEGPCNGALRTVKLLDREQMGHFEAACVAAGARFSGGVFACAALTEYELTGDTDFHAVTPHDTRSSPAEYMTLGWFTGMIPISVDVDPMSFGATARSAQACFDSGTHLAKVPFGRVLEVVPPEVGLRKSAIGSPMLSFLDAGLPPLSAMINSQLEGLNAKVYGDGDYPAQVCMWVNRLEKETSVTIFYPDNPIARDSIDRYVATLQSVYTGVAEGRLPVSASMLRRPA